MLNQTDKPLLLSPLRSPHGEELRALALSSVIGKALAAGRRPLIRNLPEACLQALLATYLPGTVCEDCTGAAVVAPAGDEYQDLVDLLLEYLAERGEPGTWLCHAIATAAMGEDHLWQDMGLPDRKALSDLLSENFPALAAKNTGDMKWKKFFYRQLCARAGLLICKAPHCADCCDHGLCFGPEEG